MNARKSLLGLLAVGAVCAYGEATPRLGTAFDGRKAENDLGTVAQVGATMLPVTAFVDDGHGGWALNGAAFAEKGVALYADSADGGWNASLTGNDGSASTEISADWTIFMRAKIGESGDRVLWYLRYGNAGQGSYLRTVARADGGLDLSFEWSANEDYPPYANVILKDVDTKGYHNYVVACSQAGGHRLFVDGELKWKGDWVSAYKDANGEMQSRQLYKKGYSAIWLGCVGPKENVGTGAWTTVYDDVRFYSTNATGDSAVPTDDEIAALTEAVKAERVPAMPAARLAVSFNDRALGDTAGVIEQVGADTLAKSVFRRNKTGGYTLDAERLEAGKGVCLYQLENTWADDQPLLVCKREVGRSFALSLVAKIAPVDGAAVCYLHYGNAGVGLVLYTVRNATGGTDLALAWLASSNHIPLPNVLATNIDTTDYHHYVLTCSADSKNTRPIRLWIDQFPVDLFTGSRLSCYSDEAATAVSTRAASSKGFSGLYLAAVRGATKGCTAQNGTRFGDVRLFAGEDATDGYGSCAVSPENIDAIYSDLRPYADRVSGFIWVIR